MEKLKKIEYVVEKVLEANKDARENNDMLYMYVCEYFDENASLRTFKDFLMTRNKTACPAYESVTRARRKVFEKRPELKPEKITKLREQMEDVYVEYAISS